MAKTKSISFGKRGPTGWGELEFYTMPDQAFASDGIYIHKRPSVPVSSKRLTLSEVRRLHEWLGRVIDYIDAEKEG